ncbi:MAG: Asp-tRNA(Asn)/Glu-tRNA(Gln) amidotransferase subunit GatC [Alphaproteobacteria bacterium]|nr:Asp-tRNA(Asn)/Glu-tRNA(Gln) amidotransferase subunit GatC [Alphaproteobacteria bacterium]
MAVDLNTVQKVARLARLSVDEHETARLAEELSQIMDWVDLLGQCDTDDVEPLAGVTVDEMPMRQDNVSMSNSRDDILRNAPIQDEGYFVVPKVVE